MHDNHFHKTTIRNKQQHQISFTNDVSFTISGSISSFTSSSVCSVSNFLLRLSKLYLSICHSIIPTEPIEYQKEPAIVTTHPTALIMLSGCLKMITEMIITQTCFTFPAILITRGEVDFVASKLETFRANAMKPLNTNNKYIQKGFLYINCYKHNNPFKNDVQKAVSYKVETGINSNAPKLLFQNVQWR